MKESIYLIKGMAGSKEWIVTSYKKIADAEAHIDLAKKYTQHCIKGRPNPYDENANKHCWTNPYISYGIVKIELGDEGPSSASFEDLIVSLNVMHEEAKQKRKLFN